jgi:hypothetical protein
MSHAELNESPELDTGDSVELALDYARLKHSMPKLNVMGGCCCTDHRDVEQIARACMPLFRGERAAAAEHPAFGNAPRSHSHRDGELQELEMLSREAFY